MLPAASAYSFGSLVEKHSYAPSDNVSVGFAALNPSGSDLRVEATVEGFDGEVSGNTEFVLPPSEVVSTSRQGYLSLSPGEYIEPARRQVYLAPNGTASGNYTLRLEARQETVFSGERTAPEVVQVREHGIEIRQVDERFEDDRDGSGGSPEVYTLNSSESGSEASNKPERNGSVIVFGQNQSKQAGGVSVNPVLILAAAVSVAFLWWSL